MKLFDLNFQKQPLLDGDAALFETAISEVSPIIRYPTHWMHFFGKNRAALVPFKEANSPYITFDRSHADLLHPDMRYASTDRDGNPCWVLIWALGPDSVLYFGRETFERIHLLSLPYQVKYTAHRDSTGRRRPDKVNGYPGLFKSKPDEVRAEIDTILAAADELPILTDDVDLNMSPAGAEFAFISSPSLRTYPNTLQEFVNGLAVHLQRYEILKDGQKLAIYPAATDSSGAVTAFTTPYKPDDQRIAYVQFFGELLTNRLKREGKLSHLFLDRDGLTSIKSKIDEMTTHEVVYTYRKFLADYNIQPDYAAEIVP